MSPGICDNCKTFQESLHYTATAKYCNDCLLSVSGVSRQQQEEEEEK
ncbi:MAG: hypothetical protein ACR2IS_19600 [Nitrososphaeraceae archaeon]